MLPSLLSAAAVLVLLASPTLAEGTAPPRACSTIRKRREWRTLSPNQKADFLNAFNQLIATGTYEQYSNTHQIHNNYIHGNPLFLPWHRAFTYILEEDLRRFSNDKENFALPFWDWGYDSQAPEMGPIWGDDRLSFGTGSGSCVTTGAFAGRKTQFNPNSNPGECLRREWSLSGGRRMAPVTSTDRLNSIISRSREYDTFRSTLEGTPHGGVHVNIGGDMAYMTSPNDPVFFLHHAMVDKAWYDWQKLRTGNFDAYGGTQATWASGRVRGTHPASKSDVLYPYQDWTVQNTFDTRKLCFEYVDLDVNDVNEDSLPPPTVSRPSGGTTQPTRPQPSAPQPVPVDRDDDDRRPSGRPTSRPSSDDDDDSRADKHHHGAGHAIKGFFKKLFNAPGADKSQLPAGQSEPADPVPVDDKVKLDYDEKVVQVEVAADDRSELIKLRHPPALSDAWLKMNGLDIAQAREYEKAAKQEINSLNQVFGYISPCALWNQVKKVAVLTKDSGKEFKATISGVIVSVKNELTEETAKTVVAVEKKTIDLYDAAEKKIKKTEVEVKKVAKHGFQAAVNTLARVKSSLGLAHLQAIEMTKKTVVTIIGEPVYAPNAAANPYRVRNRKGAANSSVGGSTSSTGSVGGK